MRKELKNFEAYEEYDRRGIIPEIKYEGDKYPLFPLKILFHLGILGTKSATELTTTPHSKIYLTLSSSLCEFHLNADLILQ